MSVSLAEAGVREYVASLGGGGDWRLVRAPGRVNLIGEHTDYNGLPVMPVALDRAVCAAFRPLTTPLVRLRGVEARFGPREFEVSDAIEPYSPGDWGNYAKAAVQALVRRFGKPRVGLEAVTDGDVPAGAGLSSSSALVVAVALAFAEVNDWEIPRVEMAELLAEGERYVGTQGGGMDQAVCLLAEAGSALEIEFFPTRATPHPVPPDVSVVVANSMVTAEKSAGARSSYNLRPTECRIACALLSGRLKREVSILADLLEVFPAEDAGGAALEIIGEGLWTTKRLADELGWPETQARQVLLRQKDGLALEEPPGGFQPARRVRHALTEALRVRGAADALDRGDAQEAGRLMRLSHASCRDDCQISCPELEALVRVIDESGAYGARLTGAGFGGCAVALAPSTELPGFLRKVQKGYYQGWLKENRPELARDVDKLPLGRYLFSPEPAAGASIAPL